MMPTSAAVESVKWKLVPRGMFAEIAVASGATRKRLLVMRRSLVDGHLRRPARLTPVPRTPGCPTRGRVRGVRVRTDLRNRVHEPAVRVYTRARPRSREDRDQREGPPTGWARLAQLKEREW